MCVSVMSGWRARQWTLSTDSPCFVPHIKFVKTEKIKINPVAWCLSFLLPLVMCIFLSFSVYLMNLPFLHISSIMYSYTSVNVCGRDMKVWKKKKKKGCKNLNFYIHRIFPHANNGTTFFHYERKARWEKLLAFLQHSTIFLSRDDFFHYFMWVHKFILIITEINIEKWIF